VVFLLFVAVAVVGLAFFARPAAGGFMVDLAEEQAGLLRNSAVREMVRASLGDATERPLATRADQRNFVVEQGATAPGIARRLTEDKLISRPIVFLLPLYESGRENALQAGTYRVSAAMAPDEMADVFQRGTGEQLVLRILEGWRLTEIAAEVQKRFPAINADAFTKAAVAGPYEYGFLRDLQPGTPLEGYLFPETYFFATDATAEDIVRTLLDTFDTRAGDAVLSAAERRKVRVADIVIIASIVEREARARNESGLIASVYWNRVALGMRLEADPTVQYAVGAWREPTIQDLAFQSPYNTYRVGGLPPTPICAAGEAALRASAEPATSEFLFFVAKNDGTGEHAFSRTLQEHEANRRKYGNR
jgi:UPF0755 protein